LEDTVIKFIEIEIEIYKTKDLCRQRDETDEIEILDEKSVPVP
jgi:hypothetical protein